MITPKIRIEVWTDIMCPYCYIGKINLDKALAKFEHKDIVEIVVKSFQLNPDLPGQGKGLPIKHYFINEIGLPPHQVEQMLAAIEPLAKAAGVTANLHNAIAANSMDAHRLIKLAARHGVASEVAKKLSKAYFEDAKDYSDTDVLIKIGKEAGLFEKEIHKMLASNQFKEEVEKDIQEAKELNIDTVPTFLFERKYAIIGSKSIEDFLDALNKSYNLVLQNHQTESDIEENRGKSCSIDGVCEI